jgi:hypothetical protein
MKERIRKILIDFHVKNMMTLDEAAEEIVKLFPPVEKTKKVDLSEIAQFIGQKFGSGVEQTVVANQVVCKYFIDGDEFAYYPNADMTLESFKKDLEASLLARTGIVVKL